MTFDSGGVQFHGGPDGSSGIVVSSGGVSFLPGKAINGTITDGPDTNTVAVSATFTFDSSGHFKSFQFNADQLAINLGSFLTLTASNFNIDTGADANHPLVSFASVGAKLTVGGLVISGQANNFAFYGDGSFHAGSNFGVVLSVGAATGDSFMWPSWLPIQIDSVGITWPNITADPTNFLLTLSASVTGIQGIDGLEFSGSIQGIQIDVGKLLQGEFPIVGISSIGVEVKGNMFGGQIDAALIGGILKIDSAGKLIADTDTTTPVDQRVFFAGLQGGFTMAGLGGFTVRLALSDLGPLTVFISATLPDGHPARPRHGPDAEQLRWRCPVLPHAPVDRRPDGPARGRLRRADERDGRQLARHGQAAGRRSGAGDQGEPVRERLGGGVHLADDDHRLGDDLLDLHLPAAVQRPGDRRDLDGREDPRDRDAELRRQQPVGQRAPLRRPLPHQLRRRDRALPRRRPRPGSRAHPVREAPDGLQERTG